MEETQARLADLKRQMESAKVEAEKPFAYATELRKKSARFAEVEAALNLGGRTGIERPTA